MKHFFRNLGFGAALAASVAMPAYAQVSHDAVKIGVLNDFNGPYADILGESEVIAAKMAVADFGGKVLGKPIELVFADHQHKTDIAAGIVRQWYEVDHVDMITGIGQSAVALAVRAIAKEKGQIDIVTAAGTTELTGKACSPTGFQWNFDTYALAKVVGQATVKTGGDSWFILSADYAFGQALERDLKRFVEEAGGKIVGSVRAPLNTPDFSSFLLQAQQSKAKIIGLGNAGADMINVVKQVGEFGIVQGGQKLAAAIMFVTDARTLGPKVAQGLLASESFYWDQTDETRAFAKRFFTERKKFMPNSDNAAIYSAITHYLKAVQAAGTDAPTAVAKKMHEMPVDDFSVHGGVLRVDGRLMRPMYLYQVKAPHESKGEWDLYHLMASVPADQAWRPLSEGGCPLAEAK